MKWKFCCKKVGLMHFEKIIIELTIFSLNL